MTEEEITRQWENARRRAIEYDNDDRAHGYVAPIDMGDAGLVNSAVQCLKCAILAEDWKEVFDALAQLERTSFVTPSGDPHGVPPTSQSVRTDGQRPT